MTSSFFLTNMIYFIKKLFYFKFIMLTFVTLKNNNFLNLVNNENNSMY